MRFSKINFYFLSRATHSASNGMPHIKKKVLELPEHRVSMKDLEPLFFDFFDFSSLFFCQNDSVVME